MLKGLPSGVFGFGERHGKCVGQDVGEFSRGYRELGQEGFRSDAFRGTVESVCQVVHDVVADVVSVCDNPLVLNVGLAVGTEGERPGSGESRKLAHHEGRVAVVVVFKFGVFAVYTVSELPTA